MGLPESIDFAVPIGATIEDYLIAAAAVYGMQPYELRHRHRRCRWAVGAAAFLCRKHPTWTVSEIAVGLGTSVSRAYTNSNDVAACVSDPSRTAAGLIDDHQAAALLRNLHDIQTRVALAVARRQKKAVQA